MKINSKHLVGAEAVRRPWPSFSARIMEETILLTYTIRNSVHSKSDPAPGRERGKGGNEGYDQAVNTSAFPASVEPDIKT